MDKPTGPCEICGGSGVTHEPTECGYVAVKCTVCNPKGHSVNYYRNWINELRSEIKGV